MKIISASRRTDIPAFYGSWLMNRVRSGFAGYINPFNNKRYTVSLKREDTAAIVLWSKNFTPFTGSALLLKDEGYSLFFNYTVTGLPGIFEPGAPAADESIDSIKFLSSRFSPPAINWRYDPVLVTDSTDAAYHREKFRSLCMELEGFVNRCYLSFPTPYGKVERSFKNFESMTRIKIHEPGINERIALAGGLSAIAAGYGIKVYSCCSDYLAAGGISKGRCVDGELISSISGRCLSRLKLRPTRKECGCTESTDIGIYNCCPHGCIYCYANSNPDKASDFHKKYVSDEGYSRSAFLGAGEALSGKWLREIELSEPQTFSTAVQPELF